MFLEVDRSHEVRRHICRNLYADRYDSYVGDRFLACDNAPEV